MRRTSLLLASLLTMAPSALAGQGTPEAAAEAFGAAVIASDWPRAARFMHPEALRVLRGFLEPLVTSTEGAQLGTQLFGVKSAAELAATPDTVLFARFLANTMKEAAGAELLKADMTNLLTMIQARFKRSS
jgi:hypothetical protein